MFRLGNLIALVVLVSAAGCTSDRPEEWPATGTVTYRGKPAARALVLFHPDPPAPYRVVPAAVTDDNGVFTLASRRHGGGLTAGEYRVTFAWRTLTTTDEGEAVWSGRDKLNERYANPRTSPFKLTVGPELPAQTFALD